MSTPLLQSNSQYSTRTRCSNCGISITRVIWKQCVICKNFNLCERCETFPYNKLEPAARVNHIQLHENIHDETPINSKCFETISILKLPTDSVSIARKLENVLKEGKIHDDDEAAVVTSKLSQLMNNLSLDRNEELKNNLSSMIIDYHVRSLERKVRVLSLDGGGIRGYMPIRVIEQLIKDEYLPDIVDFNPEKSEHQLRFQKGQDTFRNQFDYYAGTSTGGLISFCLAVGYDILKMKKIYENADYYFKKNKFGPLLWAKYDPSRIHATIDDVIRSVVLKNGKKLSPEHATLLDIHNFLNPDSFVSDDMLQSSIVRHGNLLEFIDTDDKRTTSSDTNVCRVKREKVLLITAYNATKDSITVFNTSYAEHWGYRISDVLRATMAAPTYFPPQTMSKGTVTNEKFIPDETASEIFVDGGIFANDPEFMALWAIRMQWKKLMNYHVLCIGTGQYNTPLQSSTWGGYVGWLINNGLLINMLMDATRSLTEIVSSNLAKFNDIQRMKFNYKLTKAMSLDDKEFVDVFNKEWVSLKTEYDYKSLLYFYENYIAK